jgi:hypothetical protein
LTPFNEEIQLLDPAPGGTGEWVTITAPKWEYNWVEMYEPLEGPLEFDFGYTLPDEFDNEVFPVDYVLKNKKWYLPASAIPFFNMSFYKGTPRRVQYTFNATDVDQYQPPPCYIDWPHEALLQPYPAIKFSIQHCPNIVSILCKATGCKAAGRQSCACWLVKPLADQAAG